MGLIPDAARLIPAFDLFTLPSKSEAFGYVLVEAGMAGVPVVATNVGGIPDIVTAGKTGILVPPDDVKALTDGWLNMIEHPEERARYAEAHHKQCQNFTIETMMQKTIALYSVE
jgi:glycosyltransferase involved in cell wall biosynthesis